MIEVAMPNTALTSPPAPIVKKWCSHTVKLTMVMNSVASTIER